MGKKKRKPFIYSPHGEDKEYERNDSRPSEKRKSPIHVEVECEVDELGNLKPKNQPKAIKNISMRWEKLKEILKIDE